MAAPPLVLQTTYAELLERCAQAAFERAFPADGAFTPKTVKGRRYWYFQSSAKTGRSQTYVGPETPDLLAQIEQHKQARSDERERRSLVSTLIRSFGLPEPNPQLGSFVDVLARAGVFRLRGVLIGTMAYQTYAAMLGCRLAVSALQTGDVDVAQFKDVSVAVEDRTLPMLDVLKTADATFRPVPAMHGAGVASYVARGGFRVDFLTPNRGAETDRLQRLRALQTHAQPLRFLDYLIRDPEPAVLLYGAGIYVHVPAPARFAVHKLIVAQRRPEGAAKRDKDLRQSEALIAVLAERRTFDLAAAWEEAFARGRTWRQLLLQGTQQLAPAIRERLIGAVGPLDSPRPDRRR